MNEHYRISLILRIMVLYYDLLNSTEPIFMLIFLKFRKFSRIAYITVKTDTPFIFVLRITRILDCLS